MSAFTIKAEPKADATLLTATVGDVTVTTTLGPIDDLAATEATETAAAALERLARKLRFSRMVGVT